MCRGAPRAFGRCAPRTQVFCEGRNLAGHTGFRTLAVLGNSAAKKCAAQQPAAAAHACPGAPCPAHDLSRLLPPWHSGVPVWEAEVSRRSGQGVQPLNQEVRSGARPGAPDARAPGEEADERHQEGGQGRPDGPRKDHGQGSGEDTRLYQEDAQDEVAHGGGVAEAADHVVDPADGAVHERGDESDGHDEQKGPHSARLGHSAAPGRAWPTRRPGAPGWCADEPAADLEDYAGV